MKKIFIALIGLFALTNGMSQKSWSYSFGLNTDFTNTLKGDSIHRPTENGLRNDLKNSVGERYMVSLRMAVSRQIKPWLNLELFSNISVAPDQDSYTYDYSVITISNPAYNGERYQYIPYEGDRIDAYYFAGHYRQQMYSIGLQGFTDVYRSFELGLGVQLNHAVGRYDDHFTTYSWDGEKYVLDQYKNQYYIQGQVYEFNYPITNRLKTKYSHTSIMVPITARYHLDLKNGDRFNFYYQFSFARGYKLNQIGVTYQW